MAGIYIHVPFCFSRCGYCDFYKTTKLDQMDPYFESLKNEISIRSSDFSVTVDTVYLGGGTPSLLSRDNIGELYNWLHEHFNFSPSVEWTIEVNPDDITPLYLTSLLETGFNRLSIGIQSFNDEDLRQMGRRHNAKQAIEAIKAAQTAGFKNISIDLIYGLPWSNEEMFAKSLKIMQYLSVQHLSAYHLIFEAGTQFHTLLKKGIYKEVEDESSLNQYYMLRMAAKEAGFTHYELSNFCQPNFESKHNSSYWSGEPYIGFGPGSHSFYNNFRSWNKGNLGLYNAQKYELIYEKEELTSMDAYNELIMLGLRTSKGVDLSKVRTEFAHYYDHLLAESERRIAQNHLIIENDFLKCTPEGWFLSDAIIQELFLLNG